MSFWLSQVTRFGLILVGLATSILIFRYIVLRIVLYETCAVNDDTCLKVKVWTHHNSALAHVEPQGYFVWFNGFDFLVYSDTLRSYKCGKIGASQAVPAFRLSQLSAEPESVACVDPLEDVRNFYKSSHPFYLYDRKFGRQLNTDADPDLHYYSHKRKRAVSAGDVAKLLLKRRIVRLNRM
jgi:hypothetical protein